MDGGLFLQLLFEDPFRYAAVVAGVVCSVCLHEWMHVRTACWLGDDTARRLGYLTLNPLKGMGGTSLVLLLVAGIAFGRVPVDASRFRRRWMGSAVSLAGPMTHAVLSVLCLVLLRVWLRLFPGVPEWGCKVLYTWSYMNVMLFFFNLLPIPPLDGWKVLEGVCPRLSGLARSERYGAMWFMLFGLMMVPSVRAVFDDGIEAVFTVLLRGIFGE